MTAAYSMRYRVVKRLLSPLLQIDEQMLGRSLTPIFYDFRSGRTTAASVISMG